MGLFNVSVDQTLLTHAKPEGYPALTAVPLRDLPGYLWRVKWTHVPANVAYWYSLKYRPGYGPNGELGGGSGTIRPFVHYIVAVSCIGYLFHVVTRPTHAKPYAEFYYFHVSILSSVSSSHLIIQSILQLKK